MNDDIKQLLKVITIIVVAFILFGIIKVVGLNADYKNNSEKHQTETSRVDYSNSILDKDSSSVDVAKTTITQSNHTTRLQTSKESELITEPKASAIETEIIVTSSPAKVTTTTTTPVITAKPITTESYTSENSSNYCGTFEATWYCAVDMGYSMAPYGSSGRTLETGYSVASNYFPSGTLLYIEGNGVTGTYRVDDTGGMANNVIDFYYWDRSYIPNSFLVAGRINIQVYVIQ